MEARTRTENHAGRIVLGMVASTLIAMVILMAGASPSQAQRDPYGNGGPTVKPTLIVDNSDPGDPPLERRITNGTLPFTGGDVTTFIVLGMSAIVVGTFIVRRHGRKEGTSSR